MRSIPVSIRLTLTELDQLEVIAQKRGLTVRQLLQAHVRAGLKPTRIVRPVRELKTGFTRSVSETDIDQWVALAEAGVRNNDIADQYGVSKSLVSRYLIERGVRRARHRTAA